MSGRVQQTEEFFHQFLAYIFHTPEGRRMRGPLIRATFFRTLLYLVGAVPILLVLWYAKIITTDSGTLNAAVGILLVDLAFGAALLRTIYAYRSRVRLVYRLYFSQQQTEKPEEIPPDADLDALFAQLSANDNTPVLSDTDQLQSADDTAAVEMQATFRCSRCQAEVVVPVEELDNITTCPCGGKLVQM
ncbi:MAG: hypothetical protein ACTHN5_15410 [Phycisphaerae bacterium]